MAKPALEFFPVTSIEWSEVSGHEGHIELQQDAGTYGLGAGDDRAGAWIARLPGS